MTKLVIVESPAKARTIAKYLGKEYEVTASVGHIRDLPRPSELPEKLKKGPYGKFAVNVEENFTPYYVINPDKKKKVTELRKLLRSADELYLATDEDREGEAIAWHLLEALRPQIPVKRMVFHEITPTAIQRALENTRDIDTKLVDAQETRRILDRLVGYEVSPLLWRKIAPSLSAGRVQSVATRLVVERERERMAFRSTDYWDITAELARGEETFSARLTEINGARLAQGKDFDDHGNLTARAKKMGVEILAADTAQALAATFSEGSSEVLDLEMKPYRRRPAAPFTTSTLQQEASRKLRLSSRDTMRLAQSLYENGFITYMRTDSVNLSQQALTAAREQIRELFGEEVLANKARIYTTKTKGAQEAHEAIRPAGESFLTPSEIKKKLSGREYQLYELIWKRTLASQMADARGQTASLKIKTERTGIAGVATEIKGISEQVVGIFAATGTIITEPGFLTVYEEGTDSKRYEDRENARLPELTAGEEVLNLAAEANAHKTAPPPRFTEASLVKVLEEKGIGRPSTYASTISTITDRGYVKKQGQALVPTWLAFSVVRLLEESLPDLVNYDFTADMEEDLDRIAAGQEDSREYLAEFYLGKDEQPGLHRQVSGLGDIDARLVNTISIGDGISVRVGKYGPYLEETAVDGEITRRASVPSDIAPDELTVTKAQEILDASLQEDRILGIDPQTGYKIAVKDGRFGPYVSEILPEDAVQLTPTGKVSKTKPKPKTASLFTEMSPETITLEDALQLLSLPRSLGESAGEEILVYNGRFGPYMKRGKDSRSLENEAQIFTITRAEAEEIFQQPKRMGRARNSEPLAKLGKDPVSGGEILLKDGRFGPYVTDGEINASVPRQEDINQLSEQRAQELLAARRIKIAEQGGVKRRSKTTRTAKKTTRKKSTQRRSSAKK